MMSGNIIEGIDREKCPSVHYFDCVPENIAQTLETYHVLLLSGQMQAHTRWEELHGPRTRRGHQDSVYLPKRCKVLLYCSFAAVKRRPASCCLCWKRDWNHWAPESSFEQELVSHVSLRTHQYPCLLQERTLAVLDLQGLSTAVFIVAGSFGTVDDNEYSGFDNHILLNAGVD